MSDGLWNPKDDLWDSLKRDRIRREEVEHEQELAFIRAQSHALVWTGPAEDLTRTVIKWFERGWVQGATLQEALRLASIHFRHPDGMPVIQPIDTTSDPSAQIPILNQRQSVVMPLLEAKGWSILDWATESEVAHATAIDYLNGKTKSFRSTRLKLAGALGIQVDELPR